MIFRMLTGALLMATPVRSGDYTAGNGTVTDNVTGLIWQQQCELRRCYLRSVAAQLSIFCETRVVHLSGKIISIFNLACISGAVTAEHVYPRLVAAEILTTSSETTKGPRLRATPPANEWNNDSTPKGCQY